MTPANSVINAGWEKVPRVPAGARGGGQWTGGDVNWVVPSDEQLILEYQVEHQLKGRNFFSSEAEFLSAIKRAKVVTLTPSDDLEISNRSRTETFDELLDLISSYKSFPQYRNETKLRALYAAIRHNKDMDMPIVLVDEFGKKMIFSGNTRLDIAFQLGKKPKVLMVKTKVKDGWENVPRAPAGTSEGGQWVSEGGRVVKTPFEAEEAMKRHLSKITIEQNEAIDDYTETAYLKINRWLRGDPFQKTLSGRSEEILEHLDKFFNTNPPKYNGVTYRAMRFDTGDYHKFISNVKENGILQDNGFLSTSTDEDFAKNFNTMGSNYVFVKVIGKNGVYLNGLSAAPEEHEVLFKRGSRFRVKSIQEYKGRKNWQGFEYRNYADLIIEEI